MVHIELKDPHYMNTMTLTNEKEKFAQTQTEYKYECPFGMPCYPFAR